ncbi:MAG: hypothetical protein JWP47_808 [Polaromonas sp.]|jgi:hypothetical protein|nr:hypothetical protein [Polaromonas sp.]
MMPGRDGWLAGGVLPPLALASAWLTLGRNCQQISTGFGAYLWPGKGER